MMGIEPMTSSLPRKRSTPELHRLFGGFPCLERRCKNIKKKLLSKIFRPKKSQKSPGWHVCLNRGFFLVAFQKENWHLRTDPRAGEQTGGNGSGQCSNALSFTLKRPTECSCTCKEKTILNKCFKNGVFVAVQG